MTVAALILSALGIFAGGLLVGDSFATRRYNRTLWSHQQEMDRAMLLDIANGRDAIRDIALTLGDQDMEVARSLH